MKALPIPMHARSARGINEGRKRQTRRIVKPQPQWAMGFMPSHIADVRGGFVDYFDNEYPCPYGHPGDLLYVREPWRTIREHDAVPPRDLPDYVPISYLADEHHGFLADGKYRHARFMPRRLSRLTLLVTEIRVERVQEISAEDCVAEGVECRMSGNAMAGEAHTKFIDLWDATNGVGAYERNDWAWVVCFDVIHANVDVVLADPERYGIRGAAA